MESAIGVLGILGIFALLVIAGGFIYFIIFKPGREKSAKKQGKSASRGCPICGGRMEENQDSSYLIYCTTPGCPNSRYNSKKPDLKTSDSH
jgi:hypothetical protein